MRKEIKRCFNGNCVGNRLMPVVQYKEEAILDKDQIKKIVKIERKSWYCRLCGREWYISERIIR